MQTFKTEIIARFIYKSYHVMVIDRDNYFLLKIISKINNWLPRATQFSDYTIYLIKRLFQQSN